MGNCEGEIDGKVSLNLLQFGIYFVIVMLSKVIQIDSVFAVIECYFVVCKKLI